MTDPAVALEAVRAALQPLVPKELHDAIQENASLLNDLGMDSLKVVELSLGLEEQLGYPVFLPAWISSVEDPADLTVGSLAAFAVESGE